jgi:hypothetical protein
MAQRVGFSSLELALLIAPMSPASLRAIMLLPSLGILLDSGNLTSRLRNFGRLRKSHNTLLAR